jgi:hypothetical protein
MHPRDAAAYERFLAANYPQVLFCDPRDAPIALIERREYLGAFGVQVIDLKRGRVADQFDPFAWRYVLPPDWEGTNRADGEWPTIVSLPHTIVEFAGTHVPAFTSLWARS